jgi:hypothetical protein
MEVISYMVENKANLDNINLFEDPSFHRVCYNQSFSSEIIKYLVENKEDLSNDKHIKIIENNNSSLKYELISKYGVQNSLQQVFESFQKN